MWPPKSEHGPKIFVCASPALSILAMYFVPGSLFVNLATNYIQVYCDNVYTNTEYTIYVYTCAVELRIRETETKIDNLPIEDISPKEAKFWNQEDIRKVLKPISVQFQGQVKDLKQSLRSLRNTTLGVIFLINIMWIVLLYSLSFPELENYGFDKRGFQLLFLAVFSFIIFVQSIALICHRVVTMVHYLGRTKPEEVIKGYHKPSGVNIQMTERDSLV